MDFHTYGFVALAAGIFKCIILFNINASTKLARILSFLCILFLIQHAAEFLAYVVYTTSPATARVLLDFYLVAMYFSFASMVILALNVTESTRSKYYQIMLYGCSTFLTLLHFQGYITSGLDTQGYQIIVLPASLNMLYKVFIAGCSLLTISIAIMGSIAVSDPIKALRSRSILIGLSPACLLIVTVVAGQFFGFTVTSSVLWPITTTFFLFVIVFVSNDSVLSFKLRWELLKYVILDRKADTKNIVQMITELAENSNSLQDHISQVEEIYIRAALKQTDGHQGKAANLLGIKQPTVSRKIAKYKIDTSD